MDLMNPFTDCELGKCRFLCGNNVRHKTKKNYFFHIELFLMSKCVLLITSVIIALCFTDGVTKHSLDTDKSVEQLTFVSRKLRVSLTLNASQHT